MGWFGLTKLLKMLSFIVFADKWSTSLDKCSQSATRIARSLEANNLTTRGETLASNSWLSSLEPIFKIGISAFVPAPPYSTALDNSGSTLCLRNGIGKVSRLESSSAINSSFSCASFIAMFSRKSLNRIKGWSKYDFDSFCRNEWMSTRRPLSLAVSCLNEMSRF